MIHTTHRAVTAGFAVVPKVVVLPIGAALLSNTQRIKACQGDIFFWISRIGSDSQGNCRPGKLAGVGLAIRKRTWPALEMRMVSCTPQAADNRRPKPKCGVTSLAKLLTPLMVLRLAFRPDAGLATAC